MEPLYEIIEPDGTPVVPMGDTSGGIPGGIPGGTLPVKTQDRPLAPRITAPLPPALPLPLPGVMDLNIRLARPGERADLRFIDDLQRRHTRAVGWMPTQQLEGHIHKGHVLLAEAGATPMPVGYCIGVDRYFKRDDVGIVYQMNVTPGHHHRKIGAHLLQAMFNRWPYGVRLCCCWCAQDLDANRFWEAMGFTALAFRTGSRRGVKKGQPRKHLFWQKRIRVGDEGDPARGGTPWWFPSQTGSGAIREDRLVLPIPPGVHWSRATPDVLPEVAPLCQALAAERQAHDATRLLCNKPEQPDDPEEAHRRAAQRAERRKALKEARAQRQQQAGTLGAGGLRFIPPAPGSTPTPENHSTGDPLAANADASRTPKPRHKPPKLKNDPRLVQAARHLRDRWLEQLTAQPDLLLPDPTVKRYAVGKAVQTHPDSLLPTASGCETNHRFIVDRGFEEIACEQKAVKQLKAG